MTNSNDDQRVVAASSSFIDDLLNERIERRVEERLKIIFNSQLPLIDLDKVVHAAVLKRIQAQVEAVVAQALTPSRYGRQQSDFERQLGEKLHDAIASQLRLIDDRVRRALADILTPGQG